MAKFAGVLVECACGEKVAVDGGNVFFHSWSQECDLCGSHGGIEIDLSETCSNCDRKIGSFTLSGW